METEFVVVLVTIAQRDEADALGRTLIEEALAACVNIIGPIRSIYRWQGAVVGDDEHLLVIKARRSTFDALEQRVRALHAYEIPEIIALPVVAGSTPYLDWLRASTR